MSLPLAFTIREFSGKLCLLIYFYRSIWTYLSQLFKCRKGSVDLRMQTCGIFGDNVISLILHTVNSQIIAQLSLSKAHGFQVDRKSTRLNSSHANISYAVFCLKKKTQ